MSLKVTTPPTTVMFYRATFPNEVLIAACSGYKTHAFDPLFQPRDFENYKDITAIFLSDYPFDGDEEIRGDLKDIVSKQNIQVKVYYGTKDYVKQEGDAFLGNWKGFEDFHSDSYFAAQYGKTLGKDKYAFFASMTKCDAKTFEKSVTVGKAFEEKETSQGRYAASNAIILDIDSLGCCALTSLGSSSGVHKTHEGVAELHPDVRFSILHCYRTTSDQAYFSNNWSIKDLKENEGVPNWVMADVLRCRSHATKGKQKGGSGGLEFPTVYATLLGLSVTNQS